LEKAKSLLGKILGGNSRDKTTASNHCGGVGSGKKTVTQLFAGTSYGTLAKKASRRGGKNEAELDEAS